MSQAKIRAFYTIYNQKKLADAHLVAKYHLGKEDLLNQRLRAEYNTDLIEFCRMHPELNVPPPVPQAGCCAIM